MRLDDLFDGSPTRRTPAYVYDLDGIEAAARALSAGFGAAPHLVAYAVKANTAGPILHTLRDAGCDPATKRLEIFRLEGDRWSILNWFDGDAKVRAEPLDAVELDLSLVWTP